MIASVAERARLIFVQSTGDVFPVNIREMRTERCLTWSPTRSLQRATRPWELPVYQLAPHLHL